MSIIEKYLNEVSGDVNSTPQAIQIAAKEKSDIDKAKALSNRIVQRQEERIHARAQQAKERLQTTMMKNKKVTEDRANQEKQRAKTALPTLK